MVGFNRESEGIFISEDSDEFAQVLEILTDRYGIDCDAWLPEVTYPPFAPCFTVLWTADASE